MENHWWEWVSILSSFALLVHPLCNTVLFIYCLWYHCYMENKLKLTLLMFSSKQDQQNLICSIFILKLVNFWNLFFFSKIVRINKNKRNSKFLRSILISIVMILHSSIRVKLAKTRKKVYENSFPKLASSVCFQKGLNPHIMDNKEIHRNLYKACWMTETNVGFGLLHVAPFIDHKIIWIDKLQSGYS